MGITNETKKIDKVIDVFDRLNDSNHTILYICALPLFLIRLIFDDVKERISSKIHQEEEHTNEKEILRKKIENGEVCMADLPHNRREDNNVFSFKEDKHNPLLHKIGHFVYVENEHNETLRRFFSEKQDVIRHWEEWYGCKLVSVDQEEFLKGLCFPQDREYLRHGLMYNGGCSTGDLEYGVSIRPWVYMELMPDTETSLEEQLNLIAQNLIDTEYGDLIYNAYHSSE